MRLLIISFFLACASATPQYTKTAGVKGGYGGGHGIGNMRYYNNTPVQNSPSNIDYEKGVCWVEVPTASLVRTGQVPSGNGSRSDLSRIRSCCQGYIRNIHNYRICDPVCTNDCINGLCTAPETCSCYPDHVKNLAGVCIPTCPIGCQNGYCSGGECICRDGYKLDSEGKFCVPYCRDNCGGIGNCTAPNTCGCRNGYKSTPEGSCKVDCGRCNGGECVSPTECRCHPGYTKNQEGDCVPQCPNNCQPNGQCVGPNECRYPRTTPSPHGQNSEAETHRPIIINQPNKPTSDSQHRYPEQYPGNQQQTGHQPTQYPDNQNLGGQQNYSPNNPSRNNSDSQPSHYQPGQNSNYPGQQPYYPGPQYPGGQPSNSPGNPSQNYSNNQPSHHQPGQSPNYPYQNPNYPGQQPNYPGQQSNYPGQQPYYPGQQQNYPGQQSNYPGQQQYYPGQQPYYPGSQPNYPSFRPSYNPLQRPSNDTNQQNVEHPELSASNNPNSQPDHHANYPVSQSSNQDQSPTNPQVQPINANYPYQPLYQNPYSNNHYQGRPIFNPYGTEQRPGYQSQYPESQSANVEVLCSIPCINGTCIGRDTCVCSQGFIADTTDPTGTRCIPYCPGCSNGVCVSPYVCACNPGYYMDHSVKGRAKCTARRIRRSLEESKAPVNVAELLVFEIPDYSEE